ncbi:MAG: PfkB family carbohydrate kinase [Meiothermus sp.]|uniref:PfkB family carbohydrate kinase n=1 Tax=Meiothermus sp. TaxID=1955249 RepID=UPI0025F128F0|nr:PfkB family carbohydrate kinase [Meiothermus sp.]MCS7068455.1 PfkB family carbohydrate kinase [Meiothermus sp.]MDW8425101.1 PfkB family carbohydrate kinase [Meiothermus sp.]
MVKVLSVGWANLDQRYYIEEFPPRESRTAVRAYRETLGGPAAVAAVAAARLGAEAHLLSRRGDDAAGERLEEMLQAEGVKAHFQLGAATPVSAVLVTPEGERFIFPYRPALPEELVLNEERLLKGTRAVLLDGRWAAAGYGLGQAARERGIPVVLDLDRDRDDDWMLTQVATHVVASEELAAKLGGVEALLARLQALGVFAAVTLGAEGVAHPGGRVAAHRVHVQDTTGAGDVFHGAFALAVAEGQGDVEALEFASAVAALHCAKGQPPTLAEVRAFLGA